VVVADIETVADTVVVVDTDIVGFVAAEDIVVVEDIGAAVNIEAVENIVAAVDIVDIEAAADIVDRVEIGAVVVVVVRRRSFACSFGSIVRIYPIAAGDIGTQCTSGCMGSSSKYCVRRAGSHILAYGADIDIALHCFVYLACFIFNSSF
jgi:hypothetical protein